MCRGARDASRGVCRDVACVPRQMLEDEEIDVESLAMFKEASSVTRVLCV